MLTISENKTNGNDLKGWILLTFGIFLLAVATYGTIKAEWWNQPVWTQASQRDHFAIFLAIIFCLYFLALRLRISFFTLLFFPITLYVGMAGLGPIITLIWLWTCASLIGAYIAKLIGTISPSILSFRNAGLGFAAIGFIISCIAHFPINIPSLYFTLFSILSIAAAWQLSLKDQLNLNGFNFFKRSKRPLTENILTSVVLLGITLIIAVTIIPDVGHDALAMHLNIPVRMLDTRLWRFDVTEYVWAVMPFGADWLYVPAYFLAGEQGVRLLNSSFLLAIALASYQLLVGRIGSILALVAPALLLSLPLSYLEIGTTFIEAPLTFFFLLVLIELINADHQKRETWVALGILAGYACSIKLVGILILPFLLTGALLRTHSSKFDRRTIVSIAIGIFVFLIFSLPPYLTAFIKTGNPVFPFFNTIFQSPYFAINGGDFTNPLYKRDIGFKIFWDMTINSKNFGEFGASGAIGIAFIILTPISILAAFLNRRWWIFACICSAITYIALIFHNQPYLRYAFPVLPWLLIIGTWAMSKFPQKEITATLLLLFLCAINIARFPVGYWPFQQFSYDLLWDRKASTKYIFQNKPHIVVGNILSNMSEYKDKKILLLGLDPTYNSFPDQTIADSWHSWTFFKSYSKEKDLLNSLENSEAEIIVHAIGRGYPHEAELIKITDEQFLLGDIRVGLVNPELIYTKELLKGADLRIDRGDSWHLNGATIQPNGIRVNVETPIVQQISLRSDNESFIQLKQPRFIHISLPSDTKKKRMLLEMAVSCSEGQLFRSQINWKDTNGKFISPDIQVHVCNSNSIVIKRTLLPPKNAEFAEVYGGSHDTRFIIINKISLRTSE